MLCPCQIVPNKRKVGTGRGGLNGEKKCIACTEKERCDVLLKECGGRHTNHTGPVVKMDKLLRDKEAVRVGIFVQKLQV